MNTTAEYMLTSGEWGGPVYVPLPDGWAYSAVIEDGLTRTLLDHEMYKAFFPSESLTAILCDHFAVRALTLEGWACVPWAEPDGSIRWSCHSPDEPEEGESLPAALLAEFGGEG